MEARSLLVQIQSPLGNWVDAGYLNSADNRIWFEFTERYWDLPGRPVLGQTFEEHGRHWRPSTRVALPNWFSHLLPEGRLRRAVAEAAATNTKQEFDLICRLGASDLPGATRVLPVDREGHIVAPVQRDTDESSGESDPLLKFSLAGAQLKFSVYGREGKGITVPAAGQAGNVILKFPDSRAGFAKVPEAELGCLELAKAAGISAAKAWLVSPNEVGGLEEWAARSSGAALAVERFDRRPDEVRVHMEEYAQILAVPTANEYDKYRRASLELVAVLTEALCGTDAVSVVIDRIVLNVLVGNGDAHLKNWAVVYKNGILPQLSPLYDVLPTVLYIPDDDLGVTLNKGRQFEDITPMSFRRMGERTMYGASNAEERARAAVERVRSSWDILADYLSKDSFNTLTKRLGKLRLAR